MLKKLRAPSSADDQGPRMVDQLSGSITPDNTRTPSGNQRPQRPGDLAPAELCHRCRNPRCRTKLPAAVENKRKAFCCRGCHSAFYRTRCLVCEKDTGTNPLTGEKRERLGQRKFCGRKCKAEARQFPHVYAGVLLDPVRRTTNSTSCDEMGPKTGPASDRPISLRGWSWGGDGDRDRSLYDRDGLTIARIVLEGDGRWHLRTPVTIPRQAWASLDEARRGAESFALMAMPLKTADPKLATRIKRDNETPHPMGRPLNRPPLVSDGAALLGAGSNIATAKVAGDPGPIPNFLLRGTRP
jgi:hypothetical protein